MSNTDELFVKQAALDYLQRGLPITLCDGKRPAGNDWQSRTYTVETVEAKYARNPLLNPGVILGERSGITDIEGDDENSEQHFQELFDCSEPRTWKFQSK